nr:MAG TPA: hypothetical protein [Caudoviricetes sp.]
MLLSFNIPELEESTTSFISVTSVYFLLRLTP